MQKSELLALQRIVESELEVRGDDIDFRLPDNGVVIGQGIYTIGKHIPVGVYSFYLPKQISRDAANCSYLYIFNCLEEYQQHLRKNNGELGTIATFCVYRNSPVSCITLEEGQILEIRYNGVMINEFNLCDAFAKNLP